MWIVCWGILGIYFARLTKYPLKNLLAVGIASISLIGASYLLLLIWGWWVPVTSAMLVLITARKHGLDVVMQVYGP